jgi:hypothetical protein
MFYSYITNYFNNFILQSLTDFRMELIKHQNVETILRKIHGYNVLLRYYDEDYEMVYVHGNINLYIDLNGHTKEYFLNHKNEFFITSYTYG